MTSIAFTSLFLGLVMNVQTLGVNVDGPVGAVEYLLDGKPIGRSSSRPYPRLAASSASSCARRLSGSEREDVPRATLRRILAQAGLSPEDFARLI